jgi:hypothetical protein
MTTTISCQEDEDCPAGETCVGTEPVPALQTNAVVSVNQATSVNGIPRLFDGDDIAALNQQTCIAAITSFPSGTSSTLPAGATRYIGAITYRVSDCAAGGFTFRLEGFTDPKNPSALNSTRFRPTSTTLHPWTYGGDVKFTVPVGRCCDGGMCLGELNEHCCLNVEGGNSWTEGVTCAAGCPCTTADDCREVPDNPCTDHACPNGFCFNTDNMNPCNADGLFCTGGAGANNDRCSNGSCVPGANPCTPLGLQCDEANDRCVQCLNTTHCPPDPVADDCEIPACVDGVCTTADRPDGTACDLLFCFTVERCQGGVCVPITQRTCPAGTPHCDEDRNRCAQCILDTHCPETPVDNVCTADTCNLTNGTCVHTNLTGTPCEDPLFCTDPDACLNGVCQPGPPRDCPDNFPHCNEDTNQCEECDVDGDCNDDNDCTQDVCMDGSCRHPPEPEGTSCNSPLRGGLNPCDDPDTCDGAGNCDDNTEPDGTPCPDENLCNGDETCQGGVCTPGTPVVCPPGEFCDPATGDCVEGIPCQDDDDCDDMNGCTDDTCGVDDICDFTPNSAPCNDGNACTTNDTCSGGTCVGGPPPNCDDMNDCTMDSCNPASGCVNANLPDGTICNGGNDQGECDNPDTCNGAGVCLRRNLPNDSPCTPDANDCTRDVCFGGDCTHPPSALGTSCGNPTPSDCDDPDSCDGTGICRPNNRPNGESCDSDGNDCTNDVCMGGQCTHPPSAAGTPCGNPANTDCDNPDTCNGAGVCLNNNELNGTTCTSDGIECTSDICAAGFCTHPPAGAGTPCGSPLDTDCTNPDVCNGAGTCLPNHEGNGTPCTADANDCTDDVCNNGVCVHPNSAPGTPCGSPANTDCDNPDSCNGSGQCLANREPDGTSCSDGQFCNGPEACLAGICRPGALPCRDLAHCDEADDECLDCISNTECADPNPCTEDLCIDNECVNTPIPDCVVGANRTSITKKGSLLIYPKVEIKWKRVCVEKGKDLVCEYVLAQDTFVDLANDFPEEVYVQLYFINGDAPTPEQCQVDCQRNPDGSCPPTCIVERPHPGWNKVDCQFRLTPNQPTYWSALTGLPAGCQPFIVLDEGDPPGRPDPDSNDGGRVLRGYVLAWAVDRDGREIKWNHLVGDAVVVNYDRSTAWEYNAYTFQALTATHGQPTDGQPGQLLLDGEEYETAFDKLVFDFYAVGSEALSLRQVPWKVVVSTDLTLFPVSVDLRQETEGPVVTKAEFEIWNEDEHRRSGTEKCITCWDETLLANYPGANHFGLLTLGTDKGKARVDGKASDRICPSSREAALLGVAVKHLEFRQDRAVRGFAYSAISLVGQGEEDAVIKYDVIPVQEDAFVGPPPVEAGGTAPLEEAGKIPGE